MRGSTSKKRETYTGENDSRQMIVLADHDHLIADFWNLNGSGLLRECGELNGRSL